MKERAGASERHSAAIEDLCSRPLFPLEAFIDGDREEMEKASLTLGIDLVPIAQEIKPRLDIINNAINFGNYKQIIKETKKVLLAIGAAAQARQELVDKTNKIPRESLRLLIQTEQQLTQASVMAALYFWFDQQGGRKVISFIATNSVARVDQDDILALQGEILKKIDGLIDGVAENLAQSNPRLFAKAIERLNHSFEETAWKIWESGETDPLRREDRPKIKKGKPFKNILATLLAASVLTTSNPQPDLKPLKPTAAIISDYHPDKETLTPEQPAAEPNQIFHVVEPGDWLSKIAAKYWGDIAFTRALFMINPHLGKDPDHIEVGQQVFVYPLQMKEQGFARILAAIFDAAEKQMPEEKLEALANELAIPIVNKAKDLVAALENKEKWLLFRNDPGLTTQALLKICYGESSEIYLALINRVNQMKITKEDIYPGLLVFPPYDWMKFQAEKCLLPPEITVSKKETAQTPAGENLSSVSYTVYTVQRGDTLSTIARRFGTTVEALAQANRIANKNLIYANQRLIIPDPNNPVPLLSEAQGVYRELPENLKKYLGGYWPAWEQIPDELRQWLTGIIVEETSIQQVPAWTIMAIMSAEQLGGWRLTERLSTAKAVEPLGITPGWELTFFNTQQERFNFRSQVQMVAKRLAENNLTVDALNALGEKTYREAFEVYLCKHLAGEGRKCGPEERNSPAAPGSPLKVKDYVDIGSKAAGDLQGNPSLKQDVQAIVADAVAKEIAAEEPLLSPKQVEEIAKNLTKQVDPNPIIKGEVPLKEAVKNVKQQALVQELARILQAERKEQEIPLAKFSLEKRFGGKDGAVAENIRIALAKLPKSKIILSPGETFNFNDIFGPYDSSYKTPDGGLVGGGVCDLASLIYWGLTVKADPNLVPLRNSTHGTPIPEITPANTVSILTDAQGNSVHNLIVTNKTGEFVTFLFELQNDVLSFRIDQSNIPPP